MSQAVLELPEVASAPPVDDFDYRVVPLTVPISGGLVLGSVLAFVWEPLVLIPLVGAILAFLSLRRIRREPQYFTGTVAAGIAMALNLVICCGASTLHAYSYATEVPEGFQRVSFVQDISSKEVSMRPDGGLGVEASVAELSGKPIFVKGYMYPTRDQFGLKSFVLCKDSGDCCFGGSPKVTDMIQIRMSEDRAVNFRTGMVAVAGIFKAEPTIDATGLQPVYQLDCSYFGPAKTSY